MQNIEQFPKDTQLNQKQMSPKSFLGWLSKMLGVEQDGQTALCLYRLYRWLTFVSVNHIRLYI